MKAATVTIFAIALLIAFTNAANSTTAANVTCGTNNQTVCGTILGAS